MTYTKSQNKKKFNVYRNDRSLTQMVSKGVAILVHSKYDGEIINIRIKLEAIAIKSKLPDPLTICSFYFLPGTDIRIEDLENIKTQVSNTDWVGKYTNKNEKVLEEVFDNLILLMIQDLTSANVRSLFQTWTCPTAIPHSTHVYSTAN